MTATQCDQKISFGFWAYCAGSITTILIANFVSGNHPSAIINALHSCLIALSPAYIVAVAFRLIIGRRKDDVEDSK